jgi:hypothetical protein
MSRESHVTFRAMVHFAADNIPALTPEGRETIVNGIRREARRRGIENYQETRRYITELEDYAQYCNLGRGKERYS